MLDWYQKFSAVPEPVYASDTDEGHLVLLFFAMATSCEVRSRQYSAADCQFSFIVTSSYRGILLLSTRRIHKTFYSYVWTNYSTDSSTRRAVFRRRRRRDSFPTAIATRLITASLIIAYQSLLNIVGFWRNYVTSMPRPIAVCRGKRWPCKLEYYCKLNYCSLELVFRCIEWTNTTSLTKRGFPVTASRSSGGDSDGAAKLNGGMTASSCHSFAPKEIVFKRPRVQYFHMPPPLVDTEQLDWIAVSYWV